MSAENQPGLIEQVSRRDWPLTERNVAKLIGVFAAVGVATILLIAPEGPGKQLRQQLGLETSQPNPESAYNRARHSRWLDSGGPLLR